MRAMQPDDLEELKRGLRTLLVVCGAMILGGAAVLGLEFLVFDSIPRREPSKLVILAAQGVVLALLGVRLGRGDGWTLSKMTAVASTIATGLFGLGVALRFAFS